MVQVALALDADHRLPEEPQGEGIGDGDDLHHAGLQQPLDPLAYRRLGQAYGLA